ncbi:MAG: DUF2975 domain-containing protein [Patescibacteria group bacterium]
MKRGSTLFLRIAIALMGIGVLALCTLFIYTLSTQDIGGYAPLLVGMCVSAIPFFFALYQGLALLRYIDTNKAFSDVSVKALKRIQYCAIAISTLYVVGMPYIYIVAEKDDAPGAIVIGLVITFASIVIAVFAALLQKLVQTAVDIQYENDLTV